MQQRPTAKKCTKSEMHVQKKPGCFALFVVLVAVGRCLVFVEPPSFRVVNKISHLESLSSVDSDGSEWNVIPWFVANIQHKKKSENYDSTTRAGS